MEKYPNEWECAAVLADGAVVELRPVRDDDAERIEAFHARLSDESRYLRFFSAMPKLLPGLLQRFTHVDYASRMVLLAEAAGRVVGMATYDRSAGTQAANVAFAVADAYQGRGLGTLLLEHLAAAARHNGIQRFSAETLSHNRQMIRVFLDAGFGVERQREPGLVHISFPIEPSRRLHRAVERREHQAEARSVARLLAPRAIAVIGEPGARCDAIVDRLRKADFAGTVQRELPSAAGAADLVLVLPSGADLGPVVERCGAYGVHALVLLDDGEATPPPREIVAFARHHGMRVVGPGSAGLLNTDPTIRMHATLEPLPAVSGHVGFMSQSSGVGRAVLERLLEIGLGVSSFVSVGDKADVSANDLLQYWEDDPITDVVLLQLESFGNPRKFARIARRVSRRKPIVALSAGADARQDARVAALFLQTGVISVESSEELVDVARLLLGRHADAAPRSQALVSTYMQWRRRPPGIVPELDGVDRARASNIIGDALASGAESVELDAERAAALLACYGVETRCESGSGSVVQIEARVGVLQDARFGPLLELGRRGRDKERDCRILPVTSTDARDLVRSTSVLGDLGGRPVAAQALENLLLRIARLAEEHAEVAELAVAPVLLAAECARAGRAHIRLAPHPAPPDTTARRLGPIAGTESD